MSLRAEKQKKTIISKWKDIAKMKALKWEQEAFNGIRMSICCKDVKYEFKYIASHSQLPIYYIFIAFERFFKENS